MFASVARLRDLNSTMAGKVSRRVFVTGSTDGLGLATARTLMLEGHQVVLHARSPERAAVFADLELAPLGIVIGDLSIAAETRAIAESINRIGRMDAVIHNAGVYRGPDRGTTPDGHARTLAVNALAPYILTALIDRPDRLIVLSSGMHRSAASSLDDMDWKSRPWDATAAYCESKLYITALAAALANRWPGVLSNSVDPGWVPTKMGGSGAPDDLEAGHLTQTWLAVSDDPDATVTGGYWHHRKQHRPAESVRNLDFQGRLISKLAALTGVSLS